MKTYDPKCYELALHFLEDHYEPIPERLAQELASEIQDAIESFLGGLGK